MNFQPSTFAYITSITINASGLGSSNKVRKDASSILFIATYSPYLRQLTYFMNPATMRSARAATLIFGVEDSAMELAQACQVLTVLCKELETLRFEQKEVIEVPPYTRNVVRSLTKDQWRSVVPWVWEILSRAMESPMEIEDA